MPYCVLENADQPKVGKKVAGGIASLFAGTPLPSRMRPGPPLDPDADWAAFLRLVRPLLREASEGRRIRAADFAARLEREPASLGDADARSWISDLLAACPALDQRLYKAKPALDRLVTRAIFAHFARWLVARSGATVLLGSLEVLAPRPMSATKAEPGSLWQVPNALGVRSALVGLPAPTYEATIETCCRLAGSDASRAAYLAYVLGDDRPKADHALRAAVQLPLLADVDHKWRMDWRLAPFVVELPPSQTTAFLPSAREPFFAISDVTAAEAAATAIAAAAQEGEAATPTLVWLLEGTQGADRTTVAKALLATRAEDALPALLPYLGSKLVRDAFDAADAHDPVFMLCACLTAAEGKGATLYGSRAAALVARHGTEAARVWAREGSQTIIGRLERLVAAGDTSFAPCESWPPVLREPPWRRKGKARQEIVVELSPIPIPFAHSCHAFEANDRDSYQYHRSCTIGMAELAAHISAAESRLDCDVPTPPLAEPVPNAETPPEQALAWLDRRIPEGGDEPCSFYHQNYGSLMRGIPWQPAPLALMLWGKTTQLATLSMRRLEIVSTMVARFGEEAMPGLAKLVVAQPADFLPLVATVDAADLAPAAARVLRTRSVRELAMAWLCRHPRTAAMRLLPDALGPAGATRQAAEHALRRLVAVDPAARPILDAAIAAYATVNPRVRAAVAAGVDSDPLEQAPHKPPNLPSWIVPSALARPRLTSGEALPDDAVRALCEMLVFSSPLAPYAGIAQVRAACQPESLDAFAMDLFRAWLGAGGKSVSEWAMWASVQIGGAACARDLARQIRVWASERAKPKARNGLEVLAAMGSDVALMNLDAIAEKSPFAALREQARELIQRLAAARGLSLDELADRLTPDLGLDERGGLDLSFGARVFRVGFDEMLRPWVRDAAGQRLVALPRPGKADDAALAKAAARRWSGLKANAEAVAGLQVSRLETMMSSQRRVTPDVFWRFFASHPLMRHLAGRLVWGVFEGPAPRDGLAHTFRIEEDMSLTDADDEASVLDLDAAILIGPVHPLHLDAGALARWATLFSDYEIVQPFPQLARETFVLEDDEAAGARVMRFAGKRVAGSRLRGLRPQGWATEGDGETIRAVRRAISVPEGGQLAAVLAFEDGLARHPAAGDGIQVLRALTLQDEGRAGPSATHRFGDLDPVTASEVLRAPSLLVAAGGE